MRGIITAAGSIPHHRLDRATIKTFFGTGGGTGTRSVASYDEDTTTLGVDAGRLALADAPDASPDALYFATAHPVYADKSNASIIHAALRLDRSTPAYDLGASVRSGFGALRAGLKSTEASVLVVSSDIRTGNPTSADEASGGDGAAALLVGDETAGPIIAEVLAMASATREFLDTWRAPGEFATHHWEERFAETRYAPLVASAWADALAEAGIEPASIDTLVVSGGHARAVKAAAKKLGSQVKAVAEDLGASIGQVGAADVALQLVNTLETSEPGRIIAVVSLADGVDVLFVRTTDAIRAWKPRRSVATQLASGNAVMAYAKFLSWRGAATVEPPNRPLPVRMSASAAGRSIDWKYGFVGSKDRASGAVHLPPARVSFDGGNVDDFDAVAMADVIGTIATFTIDRLAYSPSPPVIFAVVDFEGGGRLPVELTDTTPEEVAIGDTVEMTFRRLNTADGIANYFWKARPVR